jgi:hypothetical protein
MNLFFFRYISDELKNDKELVLKAVNSSGVLLEYTSKELKNDKEMDKLKWFMTIFKVAKTISLSFLIHH